MSTFLVWVGKVSVEVTETEGGFVVDGQTVRSKTRAVTVAFATAQKRSFEQKVIEKRTISAFSVGISGGSRIKLSKRR